MTLKIYTLIHVLISLIGILSGLVVLYGLLTTKRLNGWTKCFLTTTLLTSVTGFFFPFHGFTPALVTGIISLVVLAIAIFARYARHLAGAWRKTYVINAVIALYLNVFVLIAQLFLKVPALKQLAPKQTEPPFTITQLLVLGIFIVLGVIAAKNFSNNPSSPESKT